MHRTFCLVVVSLFVAACASPVDDLPREPVAAAPQPPDNHEQQADGGVIEVIDVPNAPQSAIVPETQAGNQRVCRLERRTGTNRAVRVCRTQAEIERNTVESQETFDELRRSQKEYEQ